MVVAVSLVLAGVGVGVAVAAAQAGQSQLQANKAAAQRDARELLGLLRLPNDVRRSAGRPRVGGTLVGERSASGQYFAGDQAFWTTHANPETIIAYIKAHRPRGSRIESSGSGSAGSTSSLELMLNWPPVGLQLYGRTLTVSVISGPNVPSAVVAWSQSAWIVPRPNAERVPSGARSVAITLRIGTGVSGTRHMHISTYVVWRKSRVDTLVNEFNRLPIVQPGVTYACPLMLSGEARPDAPVQGRSRGTGPRTSPGPREPREARLRRLERVRRDPVLDRRPAADRAHQPNLRQADGRDDRRQYQLT